MDKSFIKINLFKDQHLWFRKMNNEYDHIRLKDFFSKEPETLIWLNRLSKEDVLWDIGSNIGVYSIYAAKVIGNKTYAFEPCWKNTFFLQENIDINDLNKFVTAYPIAIGKEHKYDVLLNTRNIPGCTGAEVSGSELSNNNTQNYKDKKESGCVVESIDSLVEKGLTPPTHLKIDVDGLEPDIIEGAKNTLPKVKSILVELVTQQKGLKENIQLANANVVEAHLETIKKLEAMGFVIDETLSNYSKFHNYQTGFVGLYNHIYYNKNVEQ